MGITIIYDSFEKSLYNCQPLQAHSHNFTAVRTSNQDSFLDMSTKLLTLAVTGMLFGTAREIQFKIEYHGSYTVGFQSSKNFANQLNIHIEYRLAYMSL